MRNLQLRISDAVASVADKALSAIGYNNLFGSIAGHTTFLPANKSFIPLDSAGNVLQIQGSDAIWKGLQSRAMQYWAYCYCAPLASVIDRLAEADINGIVEILKTDNTEDYSRSPAAKRIKALLDKPNPIQSYEQFRGQQIVFKKIFGYSLVLCVRPAGMDKSYTKYLFNINPLFCEPIYHQSEEFSIYTNLSYIKEWKLHIMGKEYTLKADDIIMLKDGYLESPNMPGLPISKVAGLDYAVSNICAAMEADNVILRKRGPLGFISHDPRTDNVSGIVPLEPKDINELQGDLQQYGLTWSQFQYVISKHPVKWNPMSFTVKDLMTKETARQGIDMICDRMGHPAELMSGKNATYENRSSAEKYMYNTNVIPANMRDFRDYTMWFEQEQFKVGCSFVDFPLLQEDSVSQGQAELAKAEANQQLFHDEVITFNQYRTRMGIDTVLGDDIYYAEWVSRQVEKFPKTFTSPDLKNSNSTSNANKKPSKA